MSRNRSMANRNARAFRKDIQRVRKLMQRLPDTVDSEIIDTYEKHAPVILQQARSEAPGTGRLRNAIALKIYPKTNRFSLGLLTRALRRRFFFARWLEYGRGEMAKKGKYKGRRIGAILPGKYDMVAGRTRQLVNNTIVKDLKDVWERALKRAAGLL
ncbi:MAG: hypothetical protein WCO11_04305 [Sphingomonadales bacterium]|jgi:hypothetical protein